MRNAECVRGAGAPNRGRLPYAFRIPHHALTAQASGPRPPGHSPMSATEPANTLGLLADPGCYGLATDLYQLTMAAAYFTNGIGRETATFELSVRRLPPQRG